MLNRLIWTIFALCKVPEKPETVTACSIVLFACYRYLMFVSLMEKQFRIKKKKIK